MKNENWIPIAISSAALIISSLQLLIMYSQWKGKRANIRADEKPRANQLKARVLRWFTSGLTFLVFVLAGIGVSLYGIVSLLPKSEAVTYSDLLMTAFYSVSISILISNILIRAIGFQLLQGLLEISSTVKRVVNILDSIAEHESKDRKTRKGFLD